MDIEVRYVIGSKTMETIRLALVQRAAYRQISEVVDGRRVATA